MSEPRCDCHACTWARLQPYERKEFEALVDAQKRCQTKVAGLQFPDETSLDHLDLETRTLTALQADGMRSIGDVRQKTHMDLLRIPNFGRKSLNELRSKGLI